MAFTAKLGSLLSRLANIVLGFGARLNVRGTGSLTLPVPTISGTGTYTPPRYILKQEKFGSGGASVAITFDSNPAPGNFIRVNVTGSNANPNFVVTDNNGNTYHLAASGNRVGFLAEVWYAYSIQATVFPFIVTITSSAQSQADVAEYSGFGTNDPLFSAAAGQTALVGSIVITAPTPTVNPNAIGASTVCAANIPGITGPDASWTLEYNLAPFAGAGAHRLIKTAGSQSVTWTVANGGYSYALAIFQDPSDFATVRATQQVQSQFVTSSGSPRATQIAQAQVATFPVQPRVTQILLTLIVTQTICPETPVIGGVIEDGDAPTVVPIPGPICDNPGSRPILSAMEDGGDVPAAAVPTPPSCDAPGTTPIITRAQ